MHCGMSLHNVVTRFEIMYMPPRYAAVEPTSVSQPSGARVFAWYRGRPYARRGWCAFEAGASRELVARAAFFPQAPE